MNYEKMAPPGTGFAVQDTGWTYRDIFVQSLDHFIFHVNPSREALVLLILDGHISHTGNLNAIEKAEQNGIVMLSLPPHSPHRMQPLDVTYFKTLSAYFNKAADRWMRSHVGCTIQTRYIGVLLTEAFNQASVVATAVKVSRGHAQCPQIAMFSVMMISLQHQLPSMIHNLLIRQQQPP